MADVSELMWLVRESITAVTFVNSLHQQAPRTPEERTRAEAYGNLADVAEHTRATDFGLLHANSLVGLWGAVEGVVEDIAALWVAAQPDMHALPVFAKMKLPVTELLGRDRLGQARALVAELQRQERSDSRLGVGQFEAVFDPIGLGGVVDDEIRRHVLAAQQTRHLIAHRNSIADDRFVSRCPWLGIAVGERVELTTATFKGYLRACGVYVQSVGARAMDIVIAEDPGIGLAMSAIEREARELPSRELRESLRAALSKRGRAVDPTGPAVKGTGAQTDADASTSS